MSHGAAFNGNKLMATHPASQIEGDEVNKTTFISLSDFCRLNHVTKYQGRKAIALKYLVAVRRGGQWWVTPNPKCLDLLKDYLGLDDLIVCATNLTQPSTS